MERGNGPPADAYRRSSCITSSRWSISAPCLLNSRHREGFANPNFIPTCSRVSGSVDAHSAVTRAPSASKLCRVMRFLVAMIALCALRHASRQNASSTRPAQIPGHCSAHLLPPLTRTVSNKGHLLAPKFQFEVVCRFLCLLLIVPLHLPEERPPHQTGRKQRPATPVAPLQKLLSPTLHPSAFSAFTLPPSPSPSIKARVMSTIPTRKVAVSWVVNFC